VTTAVGRVLVVALLVVSMIVTGGIVLTGSTIADDGDADQRLALQQADVNEESNETPSHRNPDEYSEDGDLGGVQSQLASQLGSQLGQGAIQLSEGEYDAASEYVDDEYREQLGQYVEVSGETENEGIGNEFETAGQTQANLSESVREYQETKDEYDTAYEAGEDERARELARELEALAEEIDALGGSLRESYERIEAETGTDLSESIVAVETVTEDVRTQQETVRDQQFEETSLTLSPEREAISFTEPLVSTGELRDANGTAIADREITLAVGNHTQRVRTDSTGGFTFEYRPTNQSLSAQNLTVEYVPRTQSVYLDDEATVNVSIERQAEPTVSLEDSTGPVSYGDEVAIIGELTVDGVPVDGVALDVVLGGERIGTVNVTDGEFNGTATVPASVPDGESELGVRLPFEEQALAATADATTVTVEETESALSIETASTGDRTVSVNGTLETASGDGVEGETVQIRIDGLSAGTVTTAADGTFSGTVSVPDSVSRGDVSVTAAYDERRSNVASATAESVVGVGDTGLQLPLSVWLGGGLLALLGVGLGVWWYRRSRGVDSRPTVPADGDGSTAGGATVADRSPDPSSDTVEPLLERASEQLSNGRPDDAARTGYAAVRRALASRIDGSDALTHWEFYRRFRTADAADAALLRDITQEYERAAFDPGGVSPDEAASVLERARQLCDLDESSDGSVPADD
jgi:hypothetical protein